MNHYLKNLCLALLDRNPFQVELDELKDHYEKTAEKVRSLSNMYFACVDKGDKLAKELVDSQRLIEILRKHLIEKDELMERIKKDYQKRIESYNIEISKLRDNHG